MIVPTAPTGPGRSCRSRRRATQLQDQKTWESHENDDDNVQRLTWCCGQQMVCDSLRLITWTVVVKDVASRKLQMLSRSVSFLERLVAFIRGLVHDVRGVDTIIDDPWRRTRPRQQKCEWQRREVQNHRKIDPQMEDALMESCAQTLCQTASFFSLAHWLNEKRIVLLVKRLGHELEAQRFRVLFSRLTRRFF